MNPRWQRIASGEIPWSLEGFLAMVTFHESLMKTPCDDWDLKKIHLVDTGETITLSPLKLESQLFRFLSRRYDAEVAGSHFVRYNEIWEFVSRYRRHLTHLGLIRRDGAAMTNLFQALVELPYSRQRKDGTMTFDLPEVLRRAAEIAGSQSSHR